MNTKQLKAIQKLTNKLASLRDGFEFTLHEIDGVTQIMLSANNAGTRAWYQESDYVVILVGPQGGIKIDSASSFIRTMLL